MHRRRAIVSVVAAASALVGSAPAAVASPLPHAPTCQMLPADNIWNADISNLPVDPKSSTYVNSMGAGTGMHADFGSGKYRGEPIGIPFVVVPGTQPKVPVRFKYGSESDKGPYPVPPDAPIEGGADSKGDRHVLVADKDNCRLYELYAAYPQLDGSWKAGSGAIYDLDSNVLRTAGWTSADAAGLPILPGLVRWDEVEKGYIDHAIRMTANATQDKYIWPARHQAGDPNTSLPPMGLRFRLKASFDISGFPHDDQVILQALKTYGAFIADNGSSWYISGAPDRHWDNDVLHALGSIKGSDFEAVDESSLMVDPNSGQSAAGAVSLSAANASTKEGASGTHTVSMHVTLSGPSARTVSVHIRSTGGTATAGSDYVAVDTAVKFTPGSTDRTFKVTVDGDTAVEPDETIVFTLSSPIGALIGDGSAVLTITNDDP